MMRPLRALSTGALAGLTAIALAACASTPAAQPPLAQPTAAAGPAESTAIPAYAAPAEAAPTAVDAYAPPAEAAPTVAPAYAPPATTSPEAAAASAAPAKLNLNEVSGDELLAVIPGFTSRMVREFLEYRPYISIQQFRQEIGKYVDAAQVAQYEQYVFVPISVDAADAATLQQLPGVSETVAEELIAGRPYGSNAAFLSKLATYVAPADLAAAEQYLAAD